MTNTIDDLPDILLLEILCRLPCNKLVFQSKCVSRRWCTLISNPHFIGRFLRLQVNKKTPIRSTLINPKGEDIFTRMSSPVFKTLMTVHGLKQEPVVVGTYNDLVLCASQYHQSDYYICNPNTSQWVALPPTPTKWPRRVPVGFICDIPYYNYKQDDDALKGSDIVQLNPEYRCQVVRILPNHQFDEKYDCFKLELELFSFETGEWRVSVVLSPPGSLALNSKFSFAYKGLLYWVAYWGPQIAGLDPFMISNINSTTSSSSSNGDDVIDYYKCRVLTFDDPDVGGDETRFSTVEFLGVYGGYLRMCNLDDYSCSVCVYDLKEEQDDHGQMGDDGIRKFCLEHTRVFYLDQNMIPEDPESVVELIAVDPNNEDILYLNINGDVVMCNICTREWSTLATFESNLNINNCFFPLVLPCWPTPVPKLPQHVHHELAHGGGT